MAPYKVLLLACGSYNPPTNMHLRMFEIARDSLHAMGQYRVVGGAISPTHDAYGKNELVSSTHRCELLKSALRTSDWIRLSEWECNQECWTPTVQVLQHHQNLLNACKCDNNNLDQAHDVNTKYSGWIPKEVLTSEEPVKVMLLCGADLLESFSTPGLWKEKDIDSIVSQHGLVVITREGSNPYKFIYESDALARLQRHIFVVPEWISNNVSSTKVRRALRRQESVRYIVDDAVIDYITKHGLYGYEKSKLKYQYQDSIKNYLNIPLNQVMLTPSPSDVNMLSASPSNADNNIMLALEPMPRIDQPDSPASILTRFKNDTEVVQCPGRIVKVIPVDSPTGKNKKVGFADAPENPEKLLTCMKQTPEVQKVVLERSATTNFDSLKKPKKPARLSDSSRSRNVFRRSNSDVPTSHSNPDLESATAVKIEITKDGIKVISDKESIV